jgi:hypothetical protein
MAATGCAELNVACYGLSFKRQERGMVGAGGDYTNLRLQLMSFTSSSWMHLYSAVDHHERAWQRFVI